MNKNEIFTLWVSDGNDVLPELAYLSLKSMVLTGHEVILYTYFYLDNVPDGITVLNANEILDQSKIFKYKEGHKTYSGFANLFRLQRIYELGGTWLDLDIILIKNISERFNDEIIICTEPHHNLYSHTNNAFIRFPKKDPCVKAMLDYALIRGSDIEHGETGPRLIKKMLSSQFHQYNKYLKHFNMNNLLMWRFLNDYSKTPDELLNKLDMDEIAGFHIVNTFFDKDSINVNPNGLYNLLEKSILNANNKEEYFSNLKKYNIINSQKNDEIKNWDLKYLSVLNDNNQIISEYEYAFLIDARYLKKVEIYNLLSSIRSNSIPSYQIFFFGNTNLANDKIKFRNDIFTIASDYEDIHLDINEFIKSKYIIPINKPVIFKDNFFKNKSIESEIENHTAASGDSINIIHKKTYDILDKVYSKDIFKLTKDILTELSSCIDVKFEETDSIIIYKNCNSKINNIINQINTLNENCNMDSFLEVQAELSDLKYDNLIDDISYHYYSSFNNVLNSKTLDEYLLKANNLKLNCLVGYYLNRINIKRYIN